MIGHLLRKDLLRARRNPLPYLIQFAIPIVITAMIGLAFAPKKGGQTVAAIKIAVVDEDETFLSDFFKGSFNQGESGQFLDPQVVDREQAMALIEANEVSAVVIIPDGFTDAYLDARSPPPLELIKNPAQSFYPAIVEEMMGAAVELLNAVTRSFGEELKGVRDLVVIEEGERLNMLDAAKLLIRLERVISQVEDYLFPPLIAYSSEERLKAEAEAGPGSNTFSFVLSGMAAMFMLFLAQIAISGGLFDEFKRHTLARIRTLTPNVLPIVTGKMIFVLVVVLVCAVILLGGGGLLFRISWQNPLPISVLCLAYALFCSGLMACLAALAGDEQKMAVFGNIVVFGQAFVGGSMLPVESLPAFIRDHVSPYVPVYWFTGPMRTLENGVGELSWAMASAKLGGIGLVLFLLSIVLLDRLVAKGGKA